MKSLLWTTFVALKVAKGSEMPEMGRVE